MPKMIVVDELYAMLQSAQKGLTMLHEDPRFAHMASDIAAEITAINEIGKMIERMDAVEAEPVRHGQWIEIGADKRGRGGIQKCTACNGTYPYKCKYCPNCGAMMDAKEEAS